MSISEGTRLIAQVSNYRKAKQHKSEVRKSGLYRSIKARKFKSYEVTEIPKYEIPPLLTREEANKVLPSNIQSTDRASDVLQRIGDRALNLWLKSSSMKNVQIVQAAQKVQDAMKAEVNLAPENSEVQHKVNFQVQALEAVSRVDYSGYVNATVSFNVRNNRTGYELRRKVLRDKDFFVNHTSSKQEDLSSVGLRWSF